MSQLIKYEAACRALAECKAVDEVKAWADKAAAMQAYGRMSKDKTLEIDASEIRIRAERRLGEMLTAQKESGGLNTGAAGAAGPGRGNKNAVVDGDRVLKAPKLADAGISKDLSSRAQKLAAVPEAEFEAEVGAWRERVSAEGVRVSARLEAAGEREQKKRQPKRTLHQEESVLDRDDELAEEPPEYTEIDALRDQISELQAELVVARMGDVSEDEKQQAASLIAELQAEIKTLQVTIKATNLSRDFLMEENAQMKRQMKMQRLEISKLKEGK